MATQHLCLFFAPVFSLGPTWSQCWQCKQSAKPIKVVATRLGFYGVCLSTAAVPHNEGSVYRGNIQTFQPDESVLI